MKVIMYGAPICGDCVSAKNYLMNQMDVELEYRDITATTTMLKEFLALRDNETMFQPVKQQGKIGIPLFLLEDGTKTFQMEDFIRVNTDKIVIQGVSCSLDGKGNC